MPLQFAKNTLTSYRVYPITAMFEYVSNKTSRGVLVAFYYQKVNSDDVTMQMLVETLPLVGWEKALADAITTHRLSVGEGISQSLLNDVKQAVGYLDNVVVQPIAEYTLEGVQLSKWAGRKLSVTTFSYDFEDRAGKSKVIPIGEDLQQSLRKGSMPTEAELAKDAVCQLYEKELIEDCTRPIEVGSAIMRALNNLVALKLPVSQ